jgi:hypothetical protein
LSATACAGVESTEAKDGVRDTTGYVVCMRHKHDLDLIRVALALSAIIPSMRDAPRL